MLGRRSDDEDSNRGPLEEDEYPRDAPELEPVEEEGREGGWSGGIATPEEGGGECISWCRTAGRGIEGTGGECGLAGR